MTTYSARNDNKKLREAKAAGLKVTEIDPIKDRKLKDFILKTEGSKADLTEAYDELGVGKRPKDKQLAKRFDSARKRLRDKGLL